MAIAVLIKPCLEKPLSKTLARCTHDFSLHKDVSYAFKEMFVVCKRKKEKTNV